MRYRLPPLPPSRFARAAERLAWLSVPVALAAVLATRAGQVEPLAGIAVMAGAAILAAAALAVACVGAAEMWRTGHLGLGALFRAGAVAGLVLTYPAWLAAQALRLPVLNDVTTDLADPPVFSTSRAALAARDGHRPPDLDPRRRAVQAGAYPDLRGLVLDIEPEEAFQQVIEAVRRRKWRVIEEQRPDDRRGLGRIEAIDESRLMRLPHDITIRLRWTGRETRVDIRAAGRVGRHDFGANAARIRALVQEILNPAE
jgi:uncharacterized protein (DUF1499 family)